MRTKKGEKTKLAPLDNGGGSPTQQLAVSNRSIARKKDLIEAVRRLNPAGTTAAPTIFWDVEGSLKTVREIVFVLIFSLTHDAFIHFIAITGNYRRLRRKAAA